MKESDILFSENKEINHTYIIYYSLSIWHNKAMRNDDTNIYPIKSQLTLISSKNYASGGLDGDLTFITPMSSNQVIDSTEKSLFIMELVDWKETVTSVTDDWHLHIYIQNQ